MHKIEIDMDFVCPHKMWIDLQEMISITDKRRDETRTVEKKRGEKTRQDKDRARQGKNTTRHDMTKQK